MPAGMFENLLAPIWPILRIACPTQLTDPHSLPSSFYCNHPFHSEGWKMWNRSYRSSYAGPHNRRLFPTIQSNIKVYNTNYCNPYYGGERDALKTPWMYCTCITPFPVSRLCEAVSRIPSDPHLWRYSSKNEIREEVSSQALNANDPSAETLYYKKNVVDLV